MVKISFEICPGDEITRRFKEGARGSALVRDFDAMQINFLVKRNDFFTPAKLEQNYSLTEGEEMQVSSASRDDAMQRTCFSAITKSPAIFEVGTRIINKKSIFCYFLMKLYGDILSTSPFMNVLFARRALVTNFVITDFLEGGIVAEAMRSPRPESQSSEPQSSESQSLELPEEKKLFFIHDSELCACEVVEDVSNIQLEVESIMKMINIQPGDEVSIAGTEIKHVVHSVRIPLKTPWEKKVTIRNISVSFNAKTLVLHSKTLSGTDDKTVVLKNGYRYKKVFHTKDRKGLMGIFFEDNNSILCAELIDESQISTPKRPVDTLDPRKELASQMRRLV